jgi:hypothetical protein
MMKAAPVNPPFEQIDPRVFDPVDGFAGCRERTNPGDAKAF